MIENRDTLILGWGNPGRGDDGLGPCFVGAIADLKLDRVRTETAYQLQVEDAATIASYRQVLFVDADRRAPAPFCLGRLEPEPPRHAFSSHSVSPATVLALAEELFAAKPKAWILGIRGYAFDAFAEELSERAGQNLVQAVTAIETALRTDDLERLASATPTHAQSIHVRSDHA